MEFISNCTADAISNAAKALKEGRLVAFPTETVYGLGADATNEKAVSRIYSVKGRPTNHPLIVHISSINKLEDWATDIPDHAIKLAREFWPGPMTLILPRKGIAKNFITGGQNNVGLRVPDQPIALALLKKFEEMGGQGVAAPSANRFGAVSPTTADAVNEELGSFFAQDDLVLDGGACQIGLESTIVDCTENELKILRPGMITRQEIEFASMKPVLDNVIGKILASGMTLSHYAPKAKVTLDTVPIVGQGMIALGKVLTPPGVIRLASPENEEEFARCLYESLRAGDRLNLSSISIIQPRAHGIGLAIRDRTARITFNPRH
jgi:L-threonylcarbamoyladenylate synthase